LTSPASFSLTRTLRRIEDAVGAGSLLLLALFPVLEIVLRSLLKTGVLGQSGYLTHLVLIVGFIGGTIAAREGRHLSMASGMDHLRPGIKRPAEVVVGVIATTVLVALTWSSASFVLIGFTPDQRVGVVPLQLFVAVMPIAFGVMAFRISRPLRVPRKRIPLAVFAALFGTFLGFAAIANSSYILLPEVPRIIDELYNLWFFLLPPIMLPLVALLVVSAFLGTPLFVVLAGVALLLFVRVGGSLETIPNEGYAMLTGSTIPAIPLFTLTGYLLSEGRAGDRLVQFFRAFFGWLPGGLAIAAILASVFFTSFTGASGVTILALGGLLFTILHTNGGQSEPFTVGLLTSSSNIGLLFPPSLAIILYGTIAQINIFHLFIAGILPGMLLVLVFSVTGIIVSLRRGVERSPFHPKDAVASIGEAFWELLLPVVVVVSFFSGFAGLVETAALAVLYAIIVEVFIRKEVPLRELPGVALKCVTVTGGVLVILAAARGLSFYIIDAQIPMLLRDWVEVHISSRIAFLLLLNVALLITGCFMDIFSAILIVAPLVIPLGALFGVDPVHLGVVFIANLGLGFITPPVGLDLFLSSYRFGKGLPQIYRRVAPFFLLELSVVLIITYVPFLSTILLRIVG
jgi:C4-dicarboxylate transporter, DctM subunit